MFVLSHWLGRRWLIQLTMFERFGVSTNQSPSKVSSPVKVKRQPNSKNLMQIRSFAKLFLLFKRNKRCWLSSPIYFSSSFHFVSFPFQLLFLLLLLSWFDWAMICLILWFWYIYLCLVLWVVVALTETSREWSKKLRDWGTEPKETHCITFFYFNNPRMYLPVDWCVKDRSTSFIPPPHSPTSLHTSHPPTSLIHLN